MIISLLEKEIPYIDVRAPIEFAQGALPTSKNLPILNDKEREKVGKAYKKSRFLVSFSNLLSFLVIENR